MIDGSLDCLVCNALCSVYSVWGFKWPFSTSSLDDGLQKDRNYTVPDITRNVGGNLFISWDNLICFYNVSPLQTFHTPKFQEWKLKELRCKNGRSGRLERWWCIGIRKSSKIDSTSKSFTSSPTIFRELLKTSALCSSVNGGRHICHNRASAFLFTVIPSGYPCECHG